MGPSEFDTFEMLGLAGVVVYLGSYAALQSGLLRGSGYTYAIANLVAASLVLTSLMNSFNLSSAIIQVAWITISIAGIIRLYYIRNSMKLSARERLLIDASLPDLENDQARNLFKAGKWQSLKSGNILANEDFPVSHLHIICDGRISVFKHSNRVAQLSSGDFIGEITCFNGENATGTAITASDCVVFSIEVANLKKVAPQGSALRQSIEASIAENLRSKLARQNTTAFPASSLSREETDPDRVKMLMRDLDLVTAA